MKFRINCFYIFLILGLFIIPKSIIAQDEFYNDSVDFSTPNNLFNKEISKKIDFGVEVGSTFATYGNSNLFSSYVSPHFSMPVTERFSIDVGMTVSRGNFINMMNPYYSEFNSTGGMNLLQTSLFARGKYMLNQNVTLYGTTSISRYSLLNTFENNTNQDFNLQSMSLGLEYKFGNGSSIYIEVQKGNNPYNNGMFNQSPFGTRSTPFGYR